MWPKYADEDYSTLREVDDGLWVGDYGSFQKKPGGKAWNVWIDFALREDEEMQILLTRKRAEFAGTLKAQHVMRVRMKDGNPFEVIALRTAFELAQLKAPVLVSCMMGASRSSSAAYFILRTLRGMSHEKALNRVFMDGWPNQSTETFKSARRYAEEWK